MPMFGLGYQEPQAPAATQLGGIMRGHMRTADNLAQQRAAPDVMQEAVARLQSIGSPNAQRMAQLIQANPRAAQMMVDQSGGWGQYVQGLQAEVAAGQAERMRQEEGAAAAYGAEASGQPQLAWLASINPDAAAKFAQHMTQKKPGPQIKQVFNPETGNWEWQDVTQGGTFQAPGPSGMQVTMGPDGQFQLVQGPGAGAGMGGGSALSQPTTNKLQEQTITAEDALSRIKHIRRTYDPSALNYMTGLKDWGSRHLTKLGFMDLTDEQARGMSQRAVFRANVLDNINRTIKEITGAQMNKDEAERIIPTQANLDMSEPEFEAVLDEVEYKTREYIDRREYLLSRGIIDPLHNFQKDGVPMSLEAFQQKRDKRGDEIAKVLREERPDISDEELDKAVLAQLDREIQLGMPW